MRYSATYGISTIMQLNQRTPYLNARLQKQGLITRATTSSLWRGFLMMQSALTTLTGFDGRIDLSACLVTALRVGA